MTKPELIKILAQDVCITQKEAEAVIYSLVETIAREVAVNGRFSLVGLGTFTRAARAARVGRNPKTGESVKVEAKNVVKFRPSTELKAVINA